MLSTLPRFLIAALLAIALGGCAGSAGISTWEYRAGPDFEAERIYESRISGDTTQGIRRETCTNVSRRRIGPSGDFFGDESTACDSDPPAVP